jgi:hypothetical protein
MIRDWINRKHEEQLIHRQGETKGFLEGKKPPLQKKIGELLNLTRI